VDILFQDSYRNSKKNSILLIRLSEMLFVFALRHYLEHDKSQQGILTLYGNEKMSSALKSFYKSIYKKWNMSQTRFSA